MSAPSLPQDRKLIIRDGSLALACVAAALLGAWLWIRSSALGIATNPDVSDRFLLVLKADLPLFLWLAACVQVVSSGRFRSADDIGGSARSKPSENLAIKVAVLQNSLEQVVLAVAAHIALGLLLPARDLILVPAMALLFIAGRFAFAVGYGRSTTGRAFGMALTFLPTAFGLVLASYLSAVASVQLI